MTKLLTLALAVLISVVAQSAVASESIDLNVECGLSSQNSRLAIYIIKKSLIQAGVDSPYNHRSLGSFQSRRSEDFVMHLSDNVLNEILLKEPTITNPDYALDTCVNKNPMVQAIKNNWFGYQNKEWRYWLVSDLQNMFAQQIRPCICSFVHKL